MATQPDLDWSVFLDGRRHIWTVLDLGQLKKTDCVLPSILDRYEVAVAVYLLSGTTEPDHQLSILHQ